MLKLDIADTIRQMPFPLEAPLPGALDMVSDEQKLDKLIQIVQGRRRGESHVKAKQLAAWSGFLSARYCKSMFESMLYV